jgi:hypothetical protein
MEFNSIETNVMEAATNAAAREQELELNDLELALVGGGNIIIFVG